MVCVSISRECVCVDERECVYMNIHTYTHISVDVWCVSRYQESVCVWMRGSVCVYEYTYIHTHICTRVVCVDIVHRVHLVLHVHDFKISFSLCANERECVRIYIQTYTHMSACINGSQSRCHHPIHSVLDVHVVGDYAHATSCIDHVAVYV